jgi:hypothetical protein
MTLRVRSIRIPGILAALVKARMGVNTTKIFYIVGRMIHCSDVQNPHYYNSSVPTSFRGCLQFPPIFIKFKIDRSTFERRVWWYDTIEAGLESRDT